MKNKILIKLIVPEIDDTFDIYIPINKKVGNVINLLIKSVNELSSGLFVGNKNSCIHNKITGEKYPINVLIRETDIRNGSVIILI